MKTIWPSLLLSTWLYAGNMSLGPYSSPEFKTKNTLLKEQQAREEARRLKNEKALRAYEKRKAELAEIHAKEEQTLQEKIRREHERERALAHEAYEKEQARKELIRQRIKTNLLQAKEEERMKAKLASEQIAQEQEKKPYIPVQESEEYTLNLTPEQANISINNLDDIETELNNIDRLRYLLLHSKNTPEYIKDYIHLLNRLQYDYNLDIGFAYRGIVQSELNDNIHAAGGKYDLNARYKPHENTQIALRLEGRHQIGKYSSTEFRNEIGSLANTSASYRHEDIYLAQLWIQQEFDALSLRVGKIDPDSFIDSHYYKSASRFFFNSTFSGSPYNAFPPLGLGIAAKYVKQNVYISSEITDANAVSGGRNNDVFKESDFYKALEFGIIPDDGSKYHITAWHKDKTDNSEQMQGFIGSFVQVLDQDTHLIIRAALSDKATAEQYTSVGLGKMSLFQENDISGLSIGTLRPSNPNHRTQTTLESFYRIDPLPGVQLSGDLQLIYHPSKNTQTWALLPGLRLRVLF